MSKKLVLSVTLVTLVAVGLGYLLLNPTTDPATDTENSSQEQRSGTQSGPVKKANAGEYKLYDEAEFAAAKGTRLLFFHAPWCPQCRALEADIEANGVPEGAIIFKVDYDSNQALRQKYGVTIQTTIVKVDENGELEEKYVAYDEPTIDNVEANLL